jgi:hypothetical protein
VKIRDPCHRELGCCPRLVDRRVSSDSSDSPSEAEMLRRKGCRAHRLLALNRRPNVRGSEQLIRQDSSDPVDPMNPASACEITRCPSAAQVVTEPQAKSWSGSASFIVPRRRSRVDRRPGSPTQPCPASNVPGFVHVSPAVSRVGLRQHSRCSGKRIPRRACDRLQRPGT